MKKETDQLNLELTDTVNRYSGADPNVIRSILQHYRTTGFPYQRLTLGEIVDGYYELMRLKTEEMVNKKETWSIRSDSTSVAVANYYHPHRYGVVCNNHRTALYVFGRDHLLLKAIKKCAKMQGGISDTRLRSMLSIFEGVQVASNFPPGTAKAIYERFLYHPGVVWDMSCGFGGRLLAAMSTDSVSQYFGTEPSSLTFAGLEKMNQDIHRLIDFPPPCDVTLAMQGSETLLPPNFKSVDLCFTSPPYFDTEKYCREETQSYLRYYNRTDWIKNFIGGTVENCKSILKPDGKILINIANVNSFQNLEQATVKECKDRGLELLQYFAINFSTMPGKGKRNRNDLNAGCRTEPLFVFRVK